MSDRQRINGLNLFIDSAAFLEPQNKYSGHKTKGGIVYGFRIYDHYKLFSGSF